MIDSLADRHVIRRLICLLWDVFLSLPAALVYSAAKLVSACDSPHRISCLEPRMLHVFRISAPSRMLGVITGEIFVLELWSPLPWTAEIVFCRLRFLPGCGSVSVSIFRCLKLISTFVNTKIEQNCVQKSFELERAFSFLRNLLWLLPQWQQSWKHSS